MHLVSTNFYCKCKVSKEQKYKMKYFVDTDSFETLRNYIDECEKIYHIGKCSMGWAFCFQMCGSSDKASDKDIVPWDPSIDEVKDYLNQDDIIIYDDNGNTYSSDEFWKLIDGIVHVSADNIARPDNIKEFVIDGIRWMKGFFI